jgi:hypothetical protein
MQIGVQIAFDAARPQVALFGPGTMSDLNSVMSTKADVYHVLPSDQNFRLS